MRGVTLEQDVEALAQEAAGILGGADILQGEEVFYPTKNKITKQRIKSAKALLPTLKTALGPGEKVRYITARGFIYYTWEQFFGAGQWAMYMNSTTVALTDSRLLMFYVKYRDRTPRDIRNAIPLSEIESVKRFAALVTLKLKDGKKMRIAGLFPADAKELKSRLEDLIKNPVFQTVSAGTGGGSVQPLCPRCCKPVEIDAAQCLSCQTEFRSGKTAALRSLLLPGLGDIYLKHRFLGTIELIGSLFVWLLVLMFLIGGEFALALFFLVMVNGVDYFVTRAMAKKGVVAKSTS